VAVAVLGGAHDLREALASDGGAGCEYLRVNVSVLKETNW
jgi:hypothetical protein